MLRLVRKADILRDVYNRIPPKNLTTESGKLTLESCRLAIVGHEKTGHILVTYDGFSMVPANSDSSPKRSPSPIKTSAKVCIMIYRCLFII